MNERPTPETDRNALLLANLDDWIDDCLRNSKPIGLTLCDARKRISDQSDRIAELLDAMEILRRERDEAQEISKTFSALAWKLEGERNEARESGWKSAMQAVWERLPMQEYANDPMTPREVAKLIEFVRSQKECAK